MNITEIKQKFKLLGYWVIERNQGIYQLQIINNGNFLEDLYNIESLEEKFISISIDFKALNQDEFLCECCDEIYDTKRRKECVCTSTICEYCYNDNYCHNNGD